MPLLLPVVALVLQLVLVTLTPASVSRPAAYLSMVVGPLLAALAVGRRARASSSLAVSWWAVVASLVLWSLGAVGNLWQEWLLGHSNEMYRAATLAFNLAAVPLAFVLASEGSTPGRTATRALDALLALALGVAFFLVTWSMLTVRGRPDDEGVLTLVWLFDLQHLFLWAGALARWAAADDRTERDLFRALAAYLFVMLALNFLNNHFIAPNPAYGPEHSSIISLAFAVLAGLSLAAPGGELVRRHAGLVRVVRSASPLMIVGALLIVSLLLIRVDYASGAVGVVVAMVGFGVRATLSQVRHLEHGEQLESIASTDALTGVANRRALEVALGRLTGRASLLMVDVDFFKRLNDQRGHAAGDECLRQVASTLRGALSRSDDRLFRYGGEEFVALLDVDHAGALVVAERLRAQVEGRALEHPDSPFKVVTVSVGVASSERPAELVALADQALYEAKRAGRNQLRAAPLGGRARATGGAGSAP